MKMESDTDVTKVATDLCERIMKLTKLAIEYDQAKDMLVVLKAMSQELEVYEEVFE